jgi:glyoxalase family protein
MTATASGMHHVSALTARIGRSHAFWTGIMGMRPLIRTVNQDAPTMYHLFYGDGAGTPGSELTLFDLPTAAPERPGNHAISRVALRVRGEDVLAAWAERLDRHSVRRGTVAVRDGRATLPFTDPEGMEMALVDDGGRGGGTPWPGGPVPAAEQIRGLGWCELTVPALEETARFLTEALGFPPLRDYPLPGAPRDRVHVFGGGGGPGDEVHVAVRPDVARARYGAGGVHHLALRAPDGEMDAWAERLSSLGYANSGVVDRHYFVSVYVREPGGILFELASDGPGFEVDGPVDASRLSLPPFLEARRAEIEAALPPLIA